MCHEDEQMVAGQSGVREDRWERVWVTGEDVGKAAWSLWAQLRPSGQGQMDARRGDKEANELEASYFRKK